MNRDTLDVLFLHEKKSGTHSKDNKIQGRHSVEFSSFRVDTVQLFDGISGACYISNLPVDFSFQVGNMEEHFWLGQIGGHAQGGQLLPVEYVDGGPTLHGQIKHPKTGKRTLSSLYITTSYLQPSYSIDLNGQMEEDC